MQEAACVVDKYRMCTNQMRCGRDFKKVEKITSTINAAAFFPISFHFLSVHLMKGRPCAMRTKRRHNFWPFAADYDDDDDTLVFIIRLH